MEIIHVFQWRMVKEWPYFNKKDYNQDLPGLVSLLTTDPSADCARELVRLQQFVVDDPLVDVSVDPLPARSKDC